MGDSRPPGQVRVYESSLEVLPIYPLCLRATAASLHGISFCGLRTLAPVILVSPPSAPNGAVHRGNASVSRARLLGQLGPSTGNVAWERAPQVRALDHVRQARPSRLRRSRYPRSSPTAEARAIPPPRSCEHRTADSPLLGRILAFESIICDRRKSFAQVRRVVWKLQDLLDQGP